MGYTHYWDFNSEKIEFEKSRKTFKKVADEVKKMYNTLPAFSESGGSYFKNEPIIIKGGSGEGEPIINESNFWFNGDGSNNLDHETFCINVMQSGNEWNFCKTARKPYDLLVCCALISLANNYPANVFSFSSDGDIEDWQPAIDFYTRITNRKIKKSVFKKFRVMA